MCFQSRFNRESVSEPPNVIRKAISEFGSQIRTSSGSTSFSGLCYPRYYQESRVFATLGNGLDCSVIED